MTEKEIQPIALDGKIIDFKTKEVIEDLDMKNKKRFIDNGFEAIEEQSFTDTKTDKTYYVDYFDEIIDLLNELNDENNVLKVTNGEMEDYLARIEEEAQQLKKENEQLKKALKKKQRRIDAYEDYIKTLKEGGVLDD